MNNELILSEHPYITFDGEKVDCPPGVVIEDLRERVRTSCEVLAFDKEHRLLAVIKTKVGTVGVRELAPGGGPPAWDHNKPFVISANCCDFSVPYLPAEKKDHGYRPGPKPFERHHKPKNHKRRK